MGKLIPNLFFFFLTAPILSPYIGGFTFYLSAVFLFFDINFYSWLKNKVKLSKFYYIVTFLLIACAVPLNPALLIKCFMLVSSVTYMTYCYYSQKFYLYRYIVFNVLFALVQFICVLYVPAAMEFIGPTGLSKMVWGAFATPTYDNFFAAYFLPRVSGLSREGGFFAVLLNATLLIAIQDKLLIGKKKKIVVAFLIVGIIISLSKTSAIFLISFVILSFRNKLNKIPLAISFLSVISLLIIFFNSILLKSNFFSDSLNESFIHRFVGYAVTPKADLVDFLQGIKLPEMLMKVKGLEAIGNDFGIRDFKYFCGWPYLYLNMGITFTFFIFIILNKLKFTTCDFLLITLLTADVSPISIDGFVICSYFLCYLLKMRVNINVFSVNNKII